MFWIALADDASHALSFDDLAVLTDRLDAAANFHVPPRQCWNDRERDQIFSESAFENTREMGSKQVVVADRVRYVGRARRVDASAGLVHY